MPFAGIAFHSANCVGEVTGWRFRLARWKEQHDRTVAATDEGAWDRLCAAIRNVGFDAVEVWQAHADPSVMTGERLAAWKTSLAAHDLRAVAYAGNPTTDALRVCTGLGIDFVAGGLGGDHPDAIAERCAKAKIRFGFENHPERSVQEIRERIAGGSATVGLTVDTGFLGTVGLDAPRAIRELGPLVRHVHLKDVREAGAHATVPLGDGCVGIPECVAALREIGYAGWLSWEDEPEERNPFDIAIKMRDRIEKWMR